VVRAEQKNFNEAIELFSQTLRLDPTHETAKKHLEQAKLQLRGAANRNNSNRNPRHSGKWYDQLTNSMCRCIPYIAVQFSFTNCEFYFLLCFQSTCTYLSTVCI